MTVLRSPKAVLKKHAKDDVDYSEGMGTTRCKNCLYFLASRRCRKVLGMIEPDMWCRLFKRRAA